LACLGGGRTRRALPTHRCPPVLLNAPPVTPTFGKVHKQAVAPKADVVACTLAYDVTRLRHSLDAKEKARWRAARRGHSQTGWGGHRGALRHPGPAGYLDSEQGGVEGWVTTGRERCTLVCAQPRQGALWYARNRGSTSAARASAQPCTEGLQIPCGPAKRVPRVAHSSALLPTPPALVITTKALCMRLQIPGGWHFCYPKQLRAVE
jgi:hypothetical protein